MVQRKTAVKKRTTKAKELRSPWFIGALAVILLLTVVVIGSWAIRSVIDSNNQARLDRIESIYRSLQIGSEDYQVVSTDIFGEKRVYEWDEGRSHSSQINYVKGDTVTNTFNELDAKIREAGFEFLDEPYPGSVQKQYHYKSAQGEYIRLSVSSKQYDDAIRNAALMGKDIVTVIDEFAGGTDAGPSNVTIKVNLDDNNE